MEPTIKIGARILARSLNKEKVTNQQSSRRSFILEAASDLFATSGYSASTMDDLADKTQLNKSTIYYYYSSKADLLYEIMQSSVNDIQMIAADAVRQKSAVDALSTYIDSMVDWVIAHRSASRIMVKEHDHFAHIFNPEQFEAVRTGFRRYQAEIYGIIERGIDSGELKQVDVRIAGQMLSVLLFELGSRPSPPGGGAATIASQIKIIITEGLKV